MFGSAPVWSEVPSRPDVPGEVAVRPEVTRCMDRLLEVEHWSITSPRKKLIKIGAKVVRHGRYITLPACRGAVSRALLAQILDLIADLRAPPPKPA